VFDLAPFAVRAWNFDLLSPSETAASAVIDRVVLEVSGAMSLPELLQREANVRFESFTGKASQAQVSMRGFGENSGLRVLVVVDGQRLNRPDMGTVEWQLVPVDDIESIEVIRGGQNVLYGNYALSGVIQINTRRGGAPRSKLTVEGGSYAFLSGAMDSAGGNGPWYWDANLSALSDAGYRENSKTRNRSFSGTIGRNFGEAGAKALSVTGTVTEGSMEFPGPLTIEQFEEDPRQYGYAGDPFDYNADYLSGLFNIRYQGDTRWGAARAQLGLNARDLEWNFGGVRADNVQYMLIFTPRIRIGSEASFVIGGVDVAYSEIAFTSYLQQYRDIINSEADLSRLTVGPYLYAETRLLRDVTISGGVRFETARGDYLNRDFEDYQLDPVWEQGIDIQPPFPSMDNPFFKDPADLDPERSFDATAAQSGFAAEVTVNWELSEAVSLFVGYDRAYRYPEMDEVAAYQGFDQGTRTNPLPFNPDLDPERGHQLDLGIRFERGRWVASATAFGLDLDNEIAFDTYENINANIGPTRRYGLHLMARYEGASWGFSTQAAFVEAHFTGGTFEYREYIDFTNPPEYETFRIELVGKDVPLVPPAHGVVSAWMRLGGGFEVTAYYSYFASRWQGNDYENDNFDGASAKIPAFDRLDFSLSFEHNDLLLYARLSNALDESYAPLAFRQGFYPAPGREWRLGMKVSF